MSLPETCLHCSRSLFVPKELAGREFACPICGKELVAAVPMAEPVSEITSAPTRLPAIAPEAPYPSRTPEFDFSKPGSHSPKSLDSAELASRIANLLPPWRSLYFGLKLVQIAAWILAVLQLSLLPIVLFWPGRDDLAPILLIILQGFAVTQLTAAVLHIIGQVWCVFFPEGEIRRSARHSAWSGLLCLGAVFAGVVTPIDSSGYLIFVAPILFVYSAFHWQVFLRAVASRLGATELGRQIEMFTWWMWIGAACLIARSSMQGAELTCASLLLTAALLLVIAMYARLISATGRMVGTRAGTHGVLSGDSYSSSSVAEPKESILDFAAAGERPVERRRTAYDSEESKERIAQLLDSWHSTWVGFDQAHRAAMFLIPLLGLSVLFTSLGHRSYPWLVPMLPYIALVLLVAEFGAVLAHLRGQYRCSVCPTEAGGRSARRSCHFAWGAAATLLLMAILAAVLPFQSEDANILGAVLSLVLNLCILCSFLHWIAFLRRLSERLSARELRSRVSAFAAWFWVAFWAEFILALLELGMSGRRPLGGTCFGFLATVITLITLANYAKLLVRARVEVARRAPIRLSKRS